ncbi:MAG: hypothetical protein AB4372_04935 [Xenococcus sp. (in: cyanobacteria)]
MIYRITKNSNIPLRDRQGYYIEAKNQLDALQKAANKYPDHKEGFTIQNWS